jgi:hypothetical protein
MHQAWVFAWAAGENDGPDPSYISFIIYGLVVSFFSFLQLGTVCDIWCLLKKREKTVEEVKSNLRMLLGNAIFASLTSVFFIVSIIAYFIIKPMDTKGDELIFKFRLEVRMFLTIDDIIHNVSSMYFLLLLYIIAAQVPEKKQKSSERSLKSL